MSGGPKPRPFESFLAARENGCIEWTGTTVKSNGRESHRYGRVTRGGRKHLAHRFAYERAFGPIPQGLEVLHKCDNPLCCNPEHLELGSHLDNMQDCSRKGRIARVSRPGLKGESSPKAKLTDSDIVRMRALRAGGVTVTEIAAHFHIHNSYASRLCRGERR